MAEEAKESKFITATQLKMQDRAKNTQNNHKSIFRNYFMVFAKTPLDKHGLGLTDDDTFNMKEGWAVEIAIDSAQHLYEAEQLFMAFLTFTFNYLCNNCPGVEVQPTMRLVHGWISYVCNVNGIAEDLKSSPFVETQRVWSGIWNQPVMKNYIGERAPSFTVEDMDKLDAMPIINAKGDIHLDWLRRKLFHKLSVSPVRRGGKVASLMRKDLYVDRGEIKQGRVVLAFSLAYTKTNKKATNCVAVCECGGGDLCKFDMNHDPLNYDCQVALFETWIAQIDKYEKDYCAAKDLAPLKQDYLFRSITYQEGERNKAIPDAEKLRYVARSHWGKNGPYGTSNNYDFLDKLLNLSINQGANIEAHRNKKKKKFTSHSGKRSGIKKMEVYGKNVPQSTKLLVADHKNDGIYHEYMDGMQDLKASAGFEVADSCAKARRDKKNEKENKLAFPPPLTEDKQAAAGLKPLQLPQPSGPMLLNINANNMNAPSNTNNMNADVKTPLNVKPQPNVMNAEVNQVMSNVMNVPPNMNNMGPMPHGQVHHQSYGYQVHPRMGTMMNQGAYPGAMMNQGAMMNGGQHYHPYARAVPGGYHPYAYPGAGVSYGYQVHPQSYGYQAPPPSYGNVRGPHQSYGNVRGPMFGPYFM